MQLVLLTASLLGENLSLKQDLWVSGGVCEVVVMSGEYHDEAGASHG